MISSQHGRGFVEFRYNNIKKVYSVWICMNPPKNRRNSIACYHITEKKLVGSVKERKANYDLMAVVMICLGKERESDIDVLKLLNILLSTEIGSEDKCHILEEDFNIKMTQSLKSEVSLMCNLSKGVEEKGIEKGIRGRVSALKELNIPDATIMQKIREKFDLSGEEAESYIR